MKLDDWLITLDVYQVKYRGSYLGGTAIVLARSEKEAIEMVESDRRTSNFTEIEVHKISKTSMKPRVVYNWDGNY